MPSPRKFYAELGRILEVVVVSSGIPYQKETGEAMRETWIRWTIGMVDVEVKFSTRPRRAPVGYIILEIERGRAPERELRPLFGRISKAELEIFLSDLLVALDMASWEEAYLEVLGGKVSSAAGRMLVDRLVEVGGLVPQPRVRRWRCC